MPLDGQALKIRFPPKFKELFQPQVTPAGLPVRYRSAYGGRGGAKSRSFARALIGQAITEKHLILCTREYQNSIADSVHRVLVGQIEDLKLSRWFDVTDRYISCKLTGSEFIFKGLNRSIQEIRSLEGVTRCWIEEAQSISRDSWELLDPTIRAKGCEIWASWNTVDSTDTIYQLFVKNPLEDAIVVEVNWRDNPWFPPELDRLRRQWQVRDPDSYDWVWEGALRKISAAAIFRGKYVVEPFEQPEVVERFFFGVDWGFSNDPLACVRSYIIGDDLYIDHEYFGVGVELDDIVPCLAGGTSSDGVEHPGIPGFTEWPIKADPSRPETISYIKRKGIAISAAETWQGSVEDGVTHLKGFRMIHIHPRCVNLQREARLYSYKIDPKGRDEDGNPLILPKIEDKENHGWDAQRYALDGYIQRRGAMALWAQL